jgi:vacuolar iron transporter family protein
MMAAMALFGIGYVKGVVLAMPRWRAGIETLLMGGAASAIAFGFGYFLEPLLGGLRIE